MVCLTTGPQTFPLEFLHSVISSALSFILQQFLFSLRSSSIRLFLLPPLLFPLPSPSIACCIRQFLCQMWSFQLPFFVLSYIECSLPTRLYAIFHFSQIGPNDLICPSAPSFKTLKVKLIYLPKCPLLSTIKVSSKYEGWNFNFGNAALTFDTAYLQSSYFHRPSMYSPKLCRTRSQRWGSRVMPLAAPLLLMVRTERSTAEGLNPPCNCPIR